MTARLLTASRRVSLTHSQRLTARTRPSTCVESVCWSARHLSKIAPTRRCSADPMTKRGAELAEDRAVETRVSELKTEGTLPIDPTADNSAAWRSENSSMSGMMGTSANCYRVMAGCPRAGKRAANSSSVKSVPGSSRIMRYEAPCGKDIREMRAVYSGAGGIGCGCTGIDSLLGSIKYSAQASQKPLSYVSNYT